MERKVVFDYIYSDIRNRRRESPFVVGINGVDTSGKTCFSKEFKKYLDNMGEKTEIIHIDDFHNPKKIRRTGANEIDAYINNAFNLEKLRDNVLIPLKTVGELEVELQLLDLETDKYSLIKSYSIAKNTIVILEGILLYREPINQYFDLRVFLDIPFEDVINRATIRDVPIHGEEVLNKYETKYIPVQKWYMASYKPKEKSDIIVDNCDYNRPKIIRKK